MKYLLISFLITIALDLSGQIDSTKYHQERIDTYNKKLTKQALEDVIRWFDLFSPFFIMPKKTPEPRIIYCRDQRSKLTRKEKRLLRYEIIK